MRVAPIILALALAGCSASRPELTNPPAVTPVASDLIGTWTDQDGGFIALGQRQAVLALNGVPRSSGAVRSHATEPGMGSGRIELADGTALLVVGSQDQRRRTQAGGAVIEISRVLDTEIMAPDGRSLGRRRLWASVPLAVMAAPELAPVPPQRAVAETAPVPPQRAADPVEILSAGAVGRRGDAAELVAMRERGASGRAIAERLAAQQKDARLAVLECLEAARRGDRQAVAEAGRRNREADLFARSVGTWAADRE